MRSIACGAVLLAVLAVDAAPLAHAVATQGCTQEDGRALEVLLVERRADGAWPPPPPYVRIELPWAAWPAVLGRALPLVGLAAAGGASDAVRVRAALHPAGGAPVQWLAGTLTLNRVDIGRRVEATYDFNGAGRRWHGSFTADWVETKQSCG